MSDSIISGVVRWECFLALDGRDVI
jgi:hypothetical protein